MNEIKKYGKQLIEISGISYLSCYNDNKPSKTFVDVQMKRLANTYGNKLPVGFFSELSDAIIRNEITEMQIDEAVTHMIENDDFPSLAKLVNPLKKIVLLDRERFLRETKDESKEFKNNFVAISVDNKLFYANRNELERYKIKYEVWHKPITVPVANNNQTVSKDKRSNEKEPQKLDKSLNILDEFERISQLYQSDPDFIKLSEVKKKAQKSWGNNAYEYDLAMKEVAFLEQKLNIA